MNNDGFSQLEQELGPKLELAAEAYQSIRYAGAPVRLEQPKPRYWYTRTPVWAAASIAVIVGMLVVLSPSQVGHEWVPEPGARLEISVYDALKAARSGFHRPTGFSEQGSSSPASYQWPDQPIRQSGFAEGPEV